MKLILQTKSGRTKKEYSRLSETDKIGKLKKTFEKDFGTSVHRQRFTFIKPGSNPKDKKNKIALTDDDKTFADYDLIALNANSKDIVLIYKDLGPQISWKTVFLVEYFGPMLMHAACYLLPSLFYPKTAVAQNPKKSLTQNVALALIIFHYCKREYETLFVHRFSNATMPILNIFKNSTHYWIFGGITISYYLYHPKYTPPLEGNPIAFWGVTGMMVLCEFMNFDAHVRLKNLRKPGTKERGIPKGQLFGLVSCANYFWEIGGWFCFSLLTSCATSWLFFLMGAGQMAVWAMKKHQRYRKEFKNYPRNRKALVPFLF